MRKILILCTGNSCRSQMADGYMKYFAGDRALVFSAGVETHGVNPRAIAIMKEDGIDISGNQSDHVDQFIPIPFDFVITVCDHAQERCPVFPSAGICLHHNFPDPAKATGTETEIMSSFRSVRDQIKVFCESFVADHL